VFSDILNAFQEKMIDDRMISRLDANIVGLRDFSLNEPPNRSPEIHLGWLCLKIGWMLDFLD
jgi:hypothetical protein